MATTQASIHVKVDPEIKTKSEYILNKIGISMSDLINMTLRRVIHERRLPFDTTVDTDDIDDVINNAIATADSSTLPECLNIHTEEELITLVESRLATDEEEKNALSLEEVAKTLNLTV